MPASASRNGMWRVSSIARMRPAIAIISKRFDASQRTEQLGLALDALARGVQRFLRDRRGHERLDALRARHLDADAQRVERGAAAVRLHASELVRAAVAAVDPGARALERIVGARYGNVGRSQARGADDREPHLGAYAFVA
jgi:hypothetical protein